EPVRAFDDRERAGGSKVARSAVLVAGGDAPGIDAWTGRRKAQHMIAGRHLAEDVFERGVARDLDAIPRSVLSLHPTELDLEARFIGSARAVGRGRRRGGIGELDDAARKVPTANVERLASLQVLGAAALVDEIRSTLRHRNFDHAFVASVDPVLEP